MRIVSLLPSTTEIICDLGLGSELVGVTAECNWPQHVRDGREIVVRSFADPTLTPGEIDDFVRTQLDAGLDLYTLDDEALQRCDPDLIVSQDLCRVCAVASGDVEAATARLNCDAAILQIDPQNLSEVLESIVTIANAAGVAHRGLEFVVSLRSRLQVVLEAVAEHGFARSGLYGPDGCNHVPPHVGIRRRGRAGSRPPRDAFVANDVGIHQAGTTRNRHRRTMRVWSRTGERTSAIGARPSAGDCRGMGN